MSREPCFIDSNIPMYAVGAPHPLKEPCVACLNAVARGEVVAVTSVEVLQELLHRFTALGQRADAATVVQSFMEVVAEVLPVTREDITAALRLHQAHAALQTRDGMHLATMERHGIGIIVTADRHFDGLPGIRRVDPGDWSTFLLEAAATS
jgi:hypothetical protein